MQLQFSKSFLLVAAVACLTPLVGQAEPVTDPNLKLSIAGMKFNSFSCMMSSHGQTVSPDNCAEVNVTTISKPQTGIQFESGFLAAQGNPNKKMNFDDVVLGYHLLSKLGVTSVGLDFNPYVDVYGDGYAVTLVTETVKDSSGKVVAYEQVSPSDISTEMTLSGIYHDLYVTKDIYVGAYLGVASISYVDQTFTQASSATPEPTSTALMGSGLIGVACLFRRRMKKPAAAIV